MIVGVPREIKTAENRVALVPAGAESLVGDGHTVLVEQGAGLGSGFPDDAYRVVGASIAGSADEVWSKSEMIMKVKEPIESEWQRIRKSQVVFTYFHFAASEPLTKAIIASGCVAIAYETVQLSTGELPLLTPMSEVAGRMAVQEGAKYLEKVFGGSGILLGGVPGVLPAEVVVIGGGNVAYDVARTVLRQAAYDAARTAARLPGTHGVRLVSLETLDFDLRLVVEDAVATLWPEIQRATLDIIRRAYARVISAKEVADEMARW